MVPKISHNFSTRQGRPPVKQLTLTSILVAHLVFSEAWATPCRALCHPRVESWLTPCSRPSPLCLASCNRGSFVLLYWTFRAVAPPE